MTSGAKKAKARKKKRAELLEEEQQRVEEKERRAPVSTPTPLVTPTASIPDVPIPNPSTTLPSIAKPPVCDDMDSEPYDWYPPLNCPMFDASTLRFHDDDEDNDPIRTAASWRSPAHYPEHIRAYLYDTPTPSWFHATPELAAIHTAPAIVSVLTLRDFSALRTESAHPWRTIRRRNHRLLPQRREQRPFRKSLPKRTTIPAPHADILTVQDHIPARGLAPTPVLVPVPAPVPVPPPSLRATVTDLLSLPPIPVLVLPLRMPVPWDPYRFIPGDFSTPARELPGESPYGPVQSGLALACAREYPWITLAIANISDIAWGSWPPDVLDEREDVLYQLPPDQLVFLAVLVEICRLEPDFTGFVEPAIADFVNAWLDHCWSFG
ncbi:hypothetical protein B0H13DRAFT_1930195 [Mycena leptocephala]|nr:hypothetical protein B0H13DRAFT_1930195 [Mycena leptocephala]